MLPYISGCIIIYVGAYILAERIFERLRHIRNHADFIFVTALQNTGDVFFKRNPCLYHIVAKEIVHCDGQSVGNGHNRRQTDACGAGFDVAHVRGRNAHVFRQPLLCEIGSDPSNLDPLADSLIIQLHTASSFA